MGSTDHDHSAHNHAHADHDHTHHGDTGDHEPVVSADAARHSRGPATDHGDHDHREHSHGPGEHGHDHDHGSSWWSRGRHWVSELVGGHSHDAADQVDEALEADADGRRALLISLAGLAVTAAIQAVVVVLSGSVALLGDTLHNVADALTAVPLLIAFRLARPSTDQALHLRLRPGRGPRWSVRDRDDHPVLRARGL